ncbi:helix-turn-helix transcriptional regulator [Vibrio cholerae]|uniref:XRE family transcriptional regulator n=1 Tax=Vibrio cholerae TaxID=666 RepID=UPI001560BB0F|nr:S24 family peptidase [Vibrio cholerae]EKF9413633.1 helix-turn-helix transcriptional regulator [Vibrio cholerae]NOF59334.1 helix-turn-helix transcriptional regulator [Vibrio cholerae]NOF69422.1 helix-turn-helix transcriptional regulator [Vibrio cholerae]NOF83066.1 helix-turn-helix transcriptional regulator [Vibrio cholerae]
MSDTYNEKSDESLKNAEDIFLDSPIMRFSDRLKEAMNGSSTRAFAKKCSLSESVVRGYLSGTTFPTLNKLPQLAAAAGCSVEWLAAGVATNTNEVLGNFSDEFALIPGYRIQVSAGHGTNAISEEAPCRHLAFRRKWLKYRGFNEKDLVIVWAKGDSMEPTINNNDTLVVHTGRNAPADGHLYIFRNGDELFVKRYQNALGSWRMISDNPMYETVSIPKEEQHQFEVVGQVVHIAKDIGD